MHEFTKTILSKNIISLHNTYIKYNSLDIHKIKFKVHSAKVSNVIGDLYRRLNTCGVANGPTETGNRKRFQQQVLILYYPRFIDSIGPNSHAWQIHGTRSGKNHCR